MNKKIIAVACVFFVLVSGCGTMRLEVSSAAVNTAVYRDITEAKGFFDQVAQLLGAGAKVTRNEVFAHMRVTEKTPNIRIFQRPDLRVYVYGPSLVVSDPKAFDEELKRLTGMIIPFQKLKQELVLSAPFHTITYTEGFDVAFIFVFRDGYLHSAELSGTAIVDTKQRKVIISPADGLGAKANSSITK